MVIPTFRTWVAGEVVTAAYMNSNVRDGGNFFLATPIAELRQTVAQSLGSGAPTAILLDTEDVDTDAAHSTVTNTSRYTPQTAGYCQYSGGISYAVNATGVRGAYWYLNAAVVNATETMLATAAAVFVSVAARTKQIFANGSTDYVEIYSYQTSGGALNTAVAATGAQSGVSVRYVHT